MSNEFETLPFVLGLLGSLVEVAPLRVDSSYSQRSGGNVSSNSLSKWFQSVQFSTPSNMHFSPVHEDTRESKLPNQILIGRLNSCKEGGGLKLVQGSHTGTFVEALHLLVVCENIPVVIFQWKYVTYGGGIFSNL